MMLRALKLLERRFGRIEDLIDGSQVVNVLVMSCTGGRLPLLVLLLGTDSNGCVVVGCRFMSVFATFVDCCCDFQFEPLPMVLRGLNQFMYVL